MPWQFYCDNTRSELFMKTDPRFGLEMDKDELDKDETKIIHLFNLVTHESEIPSLERTKTAVRSIILLESLKQSDYFKVNFEGPFFVCTKQWVNPEHSQYFNFLFFRE